MENEFEEQQPKNSKRIIFVILGIIGIFVFIFALILSVKQLNLIKKGANQPNSTSNINNNPAFLYFSPPSIKMQENSQKEASSEIILDTQEKGVGIVQMEISFDPQVVSNVNIASANDKTSPFYSFKIIQTVIAQDKGKAFIVLSVDEKKEKAIRGKGKLAVLKYDLSNNKGLALTTIEITPLSALMANGKEIKYEKTDLAISFPQGSSFKSLKQ